METRVSTNACARPDTGRTRRSRWGTWTTASASTWRARSPTASAWSIPRAPPRTATAGTGKRTRRPTASARPAIRRTTPSRWGTRRTASARTVRAPPITASAWPWPARTLLSLLGTRRTAPACTRMTLISTSASASTVTARTGIPLKTTRVQGISGITAFAWKIARLALTHASAIRDTPRTGTGLGTRRTAIADTLVRARTGASAGWGTTRTGVGLGIMPTVIVCTEMTLTLGASAKRGTTRPGTVSGTGTTAIAATPIQTRSAGA